MNRHLRGRLTTSLAAFALAAAAQLSLTYGGLSPDLRDPISTTRLLLLAFGVINVIVALTVNPWRGDHLPERFPKIVQDAIVILLFGIVATVYLQERIFAASAAGAVVLGLALQDTLGNLCAGLAIQVEKPFRVGDWVRIADIDGLVSEVTWRATRIRTKTGDFVIVPNRKLADDTIVNYSEPTPATRLEIEVGVSYDVPPNFVKRTILEAVASDSRIVSIRPVEVLLKNFADSAITYEVWVWTDQFDADDKIRDLVRSALYYAFRRARIEIPYPMQVQFTRAEAPATGRPDANAQAVLRRVGIFAGLSEDERRELAAAVTSATYAAEEVVVRQGDEGTSMFVVISGEVVVTIEPDDREVSRIRSGGHFGEMSLLTGAPRNATVRATTDADLIQIALEPFKRFVLANPSTLEAIGAAVATRRSELEERRRTTEHAPITESRQTLMARIWRFFGMEEEEAVIH